MNVTIATRFRGPPRSGNGGYTCGLLGEALGGAVEVTLRKPPPLEVPLTIEVDGDRATLRDGAEEVATATRLALELEVPAPVAHEVAVEASRSYRGFHNHPYSGCFVCGPERGENDGLRIFPGKVEGRDIVAAPFTPGDEGVAVVWAALDCPGYFGAILPSDEQLPALLLGKMHAEVVRSMTVGEPHVVIGWPLGREGRKIFGATALFDERNQLIAKSRQVWIAPKS